MAPQQPKLTHAHTKCPPVPLHRDSKTTFGVGLGARLWRNPRAPLAPKYCWNFVYSWWRGTVYALASKIQSLNHFQCKETVLTCLSLIPSFWDRFSQPGIYKNTLYRFSSMLERFSSKGFGLWLPNHTQFLMHRNVDRLWHHNNFESLTVLTALFHTSDHYITSLGNCPPTPLLSQHFAVNEKEVLMLV